MVYQSFEFEIIGSTVWIAYSFWEAWRDTTTRRVFWECISEYPFIGEGI